MPHAVMSNAHALGLPLNDRTGTRRKVLVPERFLIGVPGAVLPLLCGFEDRLCAAAERLFQTHPRPVKRSGSAALPLRLAFAEALHFRLKFSRKLRPFRALCKEEAPNLWIIDFFGGLREPVFAVAACLDQVFQDIDSIIDVGHDFPPVVDLILDEHYGGHVAHDARASNTAGFGLE